MFYFKSLKVLAFMKYFIVFIFSIVLANSCKSVEFQKKPPFEIQSALYTNWTGGRPGVSGINLLIHYKTDQEVVFDSIYFQSKAGHLEEYIKDGKDYLIGRISTSKPNDISVLQDKEEQPEEKIPFELNDNEAVLVYRYQTKTFYYKLSSVEKSEDLFFQ